MDGKNITRLMLSKFPAFQHRNFRLFFWGQCISLIGTWMQIIGQAWLVLQLTNSALKLSIVSMIQFLPTMLLALFAGTLVDSFPKRKILIFTQTTLALLAATLASLTYFNYVQYSHIVVLALFLGIVNTFDTPARQSFFIELVGKDDLMNAIALNSSIFNLARIVGPSVAGLLIGFVGLGICFYLNALSFIAVIASLLIINTPLKTTNSGKKHSVRRIFLEISEGLQYIAEKKIIKQPLVLLAVVSTFVINFNVLVPVFAQQNLGQNAMGYGFLMTCMGIGSFIGALILAVSSQSGPVLKHLLGGAFGLSLFTAVLGIQRDYFLVCITFFIVGFCVTTFTALVNTTIQLNSTDNIRGRVMSVYSLVFLGVTPLGSLYAGNTAELVGAAGCMIISGIIGIIATSYTIYVFKNNPSDSKIAANHN